MNQSRQPKGIPTGGQYAASAHAESGIALDTTETTETFDLVVRGHYQRMEVPPRCRNPRPVTHQAEAVVHIPSVTDAQAPVAIEMVEGSSRDEIRFFDGNLYEPYRPYSGQTEPTMAGDSRFPDEIDRTGGMFPRILPGADSPEAFEEAVQREYRNFVVVDGEVWQRCGEPRYVVQTFGLGHNHGGTGLFPATSDNPNIAADAYFRADEFEAARAHAIEVAENRGDDQSAARIKKMMPPITVHDPSALRLVTADRETEEARKARDTFRSTAREYEALTVMRGQASPTPQQEEAAWLRMVAAREAVRKHTGDVVGHGAARRPYEQGREDLWA